jgi:DNA repair protein SbcC/Rad50
MIPQKLTLHGIGVFEDREFDFCALSGDVIAVCGPNGVGKSTLLDAIAAALWRFFPSRPGALYPYCHGRDASIGLHFSYDGQPYRSLLSIDADAARMEAWLFRNGEAITQSGKTTEYDEAVARRFGTASIALASVFAAQTKRGAFLSLPKADRKSLFVTMLGLDHLQEISDAAGAKEREARAELAGLEGELKAVSILADEEPPDLNRVAAQIADLEMKLANLKAKLSNLDRDLAARHSAAAAHNDIRRAYDADAKRLSEVHDRITKLESQHAALANLLVNATHIRTAQTRVAETETAIAALRLELGTLLERDLRAAEIGTAEQHAERLRKDLARDQRDAAIVETVPCRGEGIYASCRFLHQAAEATAKMSLKLGELANQEERLRNLQSQLAEAPASDQSDVKKRLAALERKLAEHKSVAANAERLAGAEATSRALVDAIRERAAERDRIRDRLAEYAAKLEDAKIIDAEVANLEAEQSALEARMLRVDGDLAEARKFLGGMEAQAAAIREARDRAAALKADIATKDRGRKSWRLLQAAFAKTGIQAYELDAAGPGIAGIANDLLFNCFGPRFGIRLATTRETATGSYADDFDVEVTDAERSRSGRIDDLSGGEKVIVSEALSLAIALFNRARSLHDWKTLIRDETASALDAGNASAYVAMLRRAKEIGGFHRIYFVSHQESVQALADDRIVLG